MSVCVMNVTVNIGSTRNGGFILLSDFHVTQKLVNTDVFYKYEEFHLLKI